MGLKTIPKYVAGPGRVFMTVLILLIAVSVVQVVAMAVIEAFAYAERSSATKSKPRTDEQKKSDRIRLASKLFLPDGTIHLVYELRTEAGRPVEPRTVQIYDANDKLLWEGPRGQMPYEYLSWPRELRRYTQAFEVMQIKQMQMLTPLFSQSIEVPIGSLNNTEQIWRYRPGDECFEGYAVGGERIGYIGAAGFSDSASQAEPLGECRLFTAWRPQNSSGPTLLWQTARRLYQINFEKRQTELLFESVNSDIETISLHAWRDFKPGALSYIDPQKYRPLLVCETQDGVHHLILREPDQQLSFAGPRRSVTATRQSIYALCSSNETTMPPSFASLDAYQEWLEEQRSKPHKMWQELYRIGNDGDLQLVNRYDWTEPPIPELFAQVKPMPAIHLLVAHISPPLYNLIFHALGTEFWSHVQQSMNRGSFFYAMLAFPMWLRPLNGVTNWAISALMVGFVFWYGLPRRTSNIRFAFWLVFVGLFNMSGLLTYLALNYTAAIRCPVCGRRRGLAQPDCVRCRAPLPAPKPRDLDLILMNQ